MCVILCQLLYIHHTAVDIDCGHQRMTRMENGFSVFWWGAFSRTDPPTAFYGLHHFIIKYSDSNATQIHEYTLKPTRGMNINAALMRWFFAYWRWAYIRIPSHSSHQWLTFIWLQRFRGWVILFRCSAQCTLCLFISRSCGTIMTWGFREERESKSGQYWAVRLCL